MSLDYEEALLLTSEGCIVVFHKRTTTCHSPLQACFRWSSSPYECDVQLLQDSRY